MGAEWGARPRARGGLFKRARRGQPSTGALVGPRGRLLGRAAERERTGVSERGTETDSGRREGFVRLARARPASKPPTQHDWLPARAIRLEAHLFINAVITRARSSFVVSAPMPPRARGSSSRGPALRPERGRPDGPPYRARTSPVRLGNATSLSCSLPIRSFCFALFLVGGRRGRGEPRTGDSPAR